MGAGTKLHKMHTLRARRCVTPATVALGSDVPPQWRDVVGHPLVCRVTDKRTPPAPSWPRSGAAARRQPHGPVFDVTGIRFCSRGVVGLELVASEIAKLPGIETRQYEPGTPLAEGTTERLKRLHIYVRDGAIGLRVAVGRSTFALIEVFGPGRLLPPRVWETKPGWESRHAFALLQTTTLEMPADMFERHLAVHPSLALALASGDASRCAASLDRLAMLALRDPLRRVAHTLLLLLERLPGAPGSAPSARLEVGQELIAAFAGLSRQTTNRQLRRLARAGVAGLERRVVDLRDLAALHGVAVGRRPLGR
jgi:CRP-like cAMP-binding protein